MRKLVVLTALAALAYFSENELQELKRLPGARLAPPAAEAQEPRGMFVSVDHSPFKGDKNAKVTVIEFSDYQCYFCARHVREVLPRIEKDYIQTGKVKYVVHDFPIEAIHKQAFKAAEAAQCAGEQGKYWEMRDRLFADYRALDAKSFSEHAEALGLEMPKFQQCLESGKHADKIRQDMAEARATGVRAIPTFYFGLTDPNGSRIRAVNQLRGAEAYNAFQFAIDALLSEKK